MIRFTEEICGNLDAALRREWLETNGIGGFASSTINGCNTRRYHGLLVAATKPPIGRFVLLSKLEETLIVDGTAYELGTNRYPGTVHPKGFQFLNQFRIDPFPAFTFSVDGVEIEKTVFMVQGQNTTVIEYLLKSAPKSAAVKLELRPLIAFRDYHTLTHKNGALNSRVDQQTDLISRPCRTSCSFLGRAISCGWTNIDADFRHWLSFLSGANTGIFRKSAIR